MKTNYIFLAITLFFTSCYTYKAFDPEEYALELAKETTTNPNETRRGKANQMAEARKQRTPANQNSFNNTNALVDEEALVKEALLKKEQNKNKEKPVIDPSTIKMTDIIKENKFYKVDVQGKQYTIEAKQWKADTLYAVVKGKKEELKFHKNDISDVQIRKFSKGKSDALTVAAYALGGVGVFLLLK